MPFKSEKQRRYMHANLPEIAQRWERDYASGGIARVGYQQGNQVFPFPPLNDLGNPLNDYRVPGEEFESQIPMGTDTIGMNEMFSYQKPESIYAPYGMGPDGNPYKEARTIADQNRVHGQTFTPRQLPWYNKMFNKAGQGITGLKNKMGNIFSGGKNLGANLMGTALGIPFLGSMLGSIRPDTPYEKFQKEMFADMYRNPKTGKSPNFGNKDPFGKNVRSLFGNYDVIEQADKFANSKLSQKYADKYEYKGNLFADLMADGRITDEEIEQYGLKNMGNYQVNRLRALAHAKKQATSWRAKQENTRRKHRDANLITSKMTHDGGGGQTSTPITKHHGDVAHGPGGRFQPAPQHHGNVAHGPGGRFNQPAASSSSGRDYGPHRKAEGGIISLWPK